MIGISVLGNGVVGSGVCTILREQAQMLSVKCGNSIVLRHVFVRRDYADCPYKSLLTRDFSDIIYDNSTKIVVEAMGGLYPAYDMVVLALEHKKCVVTSNKHLIAEKGQELLMIAHKNGVKLLFEAAVGGAIPLIRPLHRCLVANKIEDIQGVLNGTCNFILTQMERQDISFNDALKMAQSLGYAEVDPTTDIDSTDACRKICILASLAFGTNVNPSQVFRQGIWDIAPSDVDYAGSFGYSIKLVAHAINGFDSSAQIVVAPHLIPFNNLLYGVSDVFNGVVFSGSYCGQIFLSGKGAGSFPTASAVLADIIDCACAKAPDHTLIWSKTQCRVEPVDNFVSPFYIRCEGKRKFRGTVSLCETDKESAFITTPMSYKSLQKWLSSQKLNVLSQLWVLE